LGKNTVPSKEYLNEVTAFESSLNECLTLSQRCAGIRSPTGAHFYASVLFTTLCTRSFSFGMLLPGTSLAKKKIDHWDYASLAVVARSILEVRISFFYLCVEDSSSEEWECRWNIFNLHDCVARIHLFTELDPSSPDLKGFEAQAEELRNRLATNAFFAALPPSQKRHFLRGRDAYLVPLEVIAAAAGVEINEFRWIYKFLSSHVHGLPLSFYRMGEVDRGRGVHSEVEEGYSLLCVSFVLGLLNAARDEMHKLFGPYIKG
jgi:hypothetical protein